MAGMKTSGTRSRFDKTASSPSRRAITIFVSSRNLPLAGIHALALYFHRLDHFPCRDHVQGTRKRAQHCPALALSSRQRQRSNEPKHLLLHLWRQFIDSGDNLISESPCSNLFLKNTTNRCRTAVTKISYFNFLRYHTRANLLGGPGRCS
jgi:hypothetical protein